MNTMLFIVIGLAVLILLLMLLAPKSYHVSRSIVIDRPKWELYAVLRSLIKQEEWSPWVQKDPNMERNYEGVDGQVGFVSHWKGNKQVGEGEQEITNLIENQRVETQLRFIKPFKSVSEAYLDLLENQEGKTKVTWGFSGKHVMPMNIIMLFMDMDKVMGRDFNEGLTNLKELMEK